MARKSKNTSTVQVKDQRHTEADNATRPEVGTQARYPIKNAPQTYRYDSSLSPSLEWDGRNPAREEAESLIRQVLDAASLEDAKAAAEKLRRMSGPFLNWAGKAERQAFDVPTLPLFIHERLSTKAIVETLRAHRRAQQKTLFDWFGDPQHAIVDQHLRAYEHRDPWVNRLILGDNLAVMNSLIHLEKMAGQVQMIYMDPPYGVKYGSNFQPFVRKRGVEDGDDEDMTREPEMVQAFRDTWHLGLHSYLKYLRDRFLLARELLHPSGSIFMQISDQNLHHVREVMDEVFGADNFVAVIPFRKKTMPLGTVFIEQMSDFLVWYAKRAYDEAGKRNAKYRRLYMGRSIEGEFHHCWYELPDGTRHRMSKHQLYNHALLPPGARVYRVKSLEPSGPMSSGMYEYEFEGETYKPPKNGWGTTQEGMNRLVKSRRIQVEGNRLTFIMYADEGSATQLTAPWTDTVGADDKMYVVQTHTEVVRRCMLMTTDPGDLILDPTAGSGTAAYVAEQWGRRWITIDVSRVPLALTRQRLLTATFPWYDLKDESRGPAGGFVYKRKQNRRGEEVGGIVPHVTLGSIANNEPPEEEVLVDRPEVVKDIVRVTGPFAVEAVIAPPAEMQGESSAPPVLNGDQGFSDRMLEVLRHSPRLHLPGNRTVEFAGARVPARALWISAEASLINGKVEPVAVVFGPETGTVSEKLVYDAAMEASAKGYVLLVVVGFAVEPNARKLINECERIFNVRSAEATATERPMPAVYVQATMDLTMGDLLKNMRSSQILSVCGMPDIKLQRLPAARGEAPQYQVTLLGLDVCNPVTMEVDHRNGDDVPAWFLCTDYSGRVFHITQAFFPRTVAWDNLKRSLKGVYDDSLWEHLAGVTSAPFEAGEHKQIAVNVIDDRGNELMVVKKLDEAEEAEPQPAKAAKEAEPKPRKAVKEHPVQSAAGRVTKGGRRKS